MARLLDTIASPADLKSFSPAQLEQLADEVRQTLIEYIGSEGGHLGSNLGVVELTIAMHTVFSSPRDQIVFDTSHQCYTHKMLTGRASAYTNKELYGSVSGFTHPDESEHDFFRCGHTSTAVSLACGLAKARDLAGEKHNVIALAGDGVLSGGEAFEGLDNAALVGTNLIIVINDNEMSIAENRGGIYEGLACLRESGGASQPNLFEALGLEYRYLEQGHNIQALIAAFEELRDIDHPVVLHVHTTKGRGSAWAEEHKEEAHSVKPASFAVPARDYRALTREVLCEHISRDPQVIVVNAGAPGGSGVTQEFREFAGNQFFDVGICEQHAVSFCAGLARGGAKPVYLVHSTFLQRAYDQLVQDLALNGLPVTIVVFEAGFSSLDATHVGCFDIAYSGNIPGLTCLAPASCEQYCAMLDWAIDQQETPVLIRVPNRMHEGGAPVSFSSEDIGRFELTHEGDTIALVGLGSIVELVEEVAEELRTRANINPTIISATTFSSLDRDLLKSLVGPHKLVATFEDGMLYGGFGEKVARYLGMEDIGVLCYGGVKEFLDRVSTRALQKRFHLEATLVAQDIVAAL